MSAYARRRNPGRLKVFFQAKKKPRERELSGFGIKRLAIPYFRTTTCRTIIGAKRVHFRVRDGIGWFTLAMVTKQTGAVDDAGQPSAGLSPGLGNL